jgi:YcaO-like protein with predicted kinase domain
MQTVERVLALRRVFGITRVADITGLDRVGIPVVSVYRPNSRSLVTAQGKGSSLAAAKASGLMEAIESFHAERVQLPLRLASYRELSCGVPVVDPSLLPRCRQSRFRPDLQLLWVEAWNLLGERDTDTVWLPLECVHANFSLPLPTGSGAFLLSSNGLAAGNHMLEALSHAICEVVERDANALWHSQAGQPAAQQHRIDLRSVTDEECLDALERLARAGLLVGAWDITSDVRVPTLLVEIADRDEGPLRVSYATSGLGCHPSPSVALLRALTEAAQCRLTLIAGTRDDADRGVYERARDNGVLARARARLQGNATPGVDFASLEDHAHLTFEGDLQWELEQLAGAGITQVLCLDLSLPGIDIPVVRVVIPGLEGIHEIPGYVPGARARAALALGTA